MKELKILCPHCDGTLKINNEIRCENCSKIFSYEDDIIELNNNLKDKKSLNETEFFLKEINKQGYQKGVNLFIKKFPKYSTQLINSEFNQSIDHLFYCLTKENNHCLVLENQFGNTIETLSNVFHHVISQNTSQDFLKIQSQRFKQIDKNNVTLIHSNFEKLLFPDNYFDLIVVENLFDKINIKDKKKVSILISEISRILRSGGCLVFNHKEANSDLKQILDNSNLKIRKYWSMQTDQNPSFSGKYEDDIGLKWYMDNLSNFLATKKISFKKKMMLWTIKKGSKQTTRIFKKKFVPTIAFCCFKNKVPITISDFVEKEIGYKHFVIQSRPKKIVGILIGKKGLAQKIVNFNRYGFDFPSEITTVTRQFPKMNDPNKRLWVEDWFDGISINPQNVEDVFSALDWLIKFQNMTKQGLIDKNDINREMDELKNSIKKNSSLNDSQCFKWIDEYKLFREKNTFHYTAIHGDFWINNILINPDTSKIHIIDWEKYKQKGDPLYDFMFFFVRLMTKTKNSSLDIERFQNCINEKTNDYKKIIQLVKKINLHFNCDFNLLAVLRIFIIRRILESPYGTSIVIKKDKDTQVEMLRLLSERQHI